MEKLFVELIINAVNYEINIGINYKVFIQLKTKSILLLVKYAGSII